jgi:hypothetical protein
MIEVPEIAKTHGWQNDLCGCCDDCAILCAGWAFSGTVSALNFAESRGEHWTACHLFESTNYCCIGFWTRANIDRARGREPDLCMNCCVKVLPFLLPCSICQETRELKSLRRLQKDAKKGGGQKSSVVVVEYARGAAPVVGGAHPIYPGGGPPAGYGYPSQAPAPAPSGSMYQPAPPPSQPSQQGFSQQGFSQQQGGYGTYPDQQYQ